MQIVLWGFNQKTDEVLDYLKSENHIDDVIYIAARSLFYSIDGISIIERSIQECINEADWVILCDNTPYCNDKIKQDKLILVEALLENVCFSFEQYLKFKKRRISIVSSSDWGKRVYESLYIKANTPFVDVRIASSDYLLLLSDFENTMKQPLTRGGDSSTLNDTFGFIGDRIKIEFPKASTFDDALKCWKEKLRIFNWDDYFFEMDNFKSYEQLVQFRGLQKKEKIAFFQDGKQEGSFYLPQWDRQEIRKKYRWFDNYIARTAYRKFDGIKPYNVLGILLGGTND